MLRAIRFIVDLFTQRHGIVAFVFFLALGLLMRQSPTPIRESIVSTAVSTLYFPAQRIVSAVGHYKAIAEENEQLKEENARLRQETYHAREGLQELARLHTLVRFDDKWDFPIVTARVIGHNPGRFLTTMVINRHSRVQLLVDPNLKLSVMDRRTRVVGFLESMDGVRLTALVPTHAGVHAGDTLVTSGLGGIFPKGIPVGTVKDVRKSDLDVMRQMEVSPFQDFSILEEVFVMEKEPDWIIKELLDE